MQDELGRDDFNLQEAFVLARETLKALLIINGAGAIALLTFYGNLLSKTNFTLSAVSAGFLTASLAAFAAGVLFAVLATAFGYLTQLHWGAAAFHDRALVAKARRAKRFHLLAFAAAALSVLSFVVGAASAAIGLWNAV